MNFNTFHVRLNDLTTFCPASPSFSGKDKSKRLDKSDAKYVECIHTNAMCYGMMDPFCSADFYPVQYFTYSSNHSREFKYNNSFYFVKNCGFVQPG